MLSYEQVRDEIGLPEKKRNHLLLGNGFSIAFYISLYDNPDSEANHKIMGNVAAVREKRTKLVEAKQMSKPLSVQYYDASSAKVWG